MPRSKTKQTSNRTSKFNIKTSSDFMRVLQTARKTDKRYSKTRRLKNAVISHKTMEALSKFIELNYGDILWSIYTDPVTHIQTNFTRRVVTKMITDETEKLAKLELDLQQQLVDEQNFASTTIIVGDDEQAGDGNCHILCVNIGLGDCTLITSPKGVRILVDMGSDSLMDAIIGKVWDPTTKKMVDYNPTVQTNYATLAKQKVLDVIRSKLFLNGTKNIHFLVLSHPDGDHHNKITWLDPTVKIGRSYYSGANFDEYSTASLDNTKTFVLNACGNSELSIKKTTLKQIPNGTVIRQLDDRDITATSWAPGNEIFDKEYIDQATGEIVIYKEVDTNFTLSILAGNVDGVIVGDTSYRNDAEIKTAPQEAKLKRNSNDRNRQSLVVKVEFNNKKAIILGDATAITENFLVNQYANNALKDLYLCRMGHHGSPTSSAYRFVSAMTNLEKAVSSTSGKFTALHSLPIGEILDLYGGVPSNSQGHSIYAYSIDNLNTKKSYFKNINNNILTTGSNGTRKITIQKSG